MSNPAPKKIILLGATGSIGGSTLRVLREHPDKLELVGVAANQNYRELAAICREFDVPHAALTDCDAARAARSEKVFPSTTNLYDGPDALCEIARLSEGELVLIAVVGSCGLKPALAAIENGKDLALANKELLVLGGAFVIEAARKKGVRLLPIDSEHNAIFQCLQGHPPEHLEKLILTASGGQFRDTALSDLAGVTPAQATQHPNWSMGPKITVDSATMANKGLELIEAFWLFDLDPSQLEVVIHPQSLIHSFVQFIDGSILAQLSPPSMTFAIQHCLLYPERASGVDATLDFGQAMQLDFTPPDYERYPCLRLAYEALQAGGCAPAVYNAANEIAVGRFLSKSIGYLDIPRIVEHTLEAVEAITPNSIRELFALDTEARRKAGSFAKLLD